ncbi:MAG TPA: SseB family protein [Microcella sp.]|nr:SseB family protein [Microcella sp.]
MSGPADSAGQPWAGRSFEPNPNAADDGSAPSAFLDAHTAFRAGRIGIADVVDVVRTCRFLIPLVAVAGETGVGPDGQLVDKSQELSIITVEGPDGRAVLPVFSSTAAMAAWRADARPVPADAVRVALAAASENTDRVVIDPRSETLTVLPRPAVWAIAQSVPWIPAVHDDAVVEAISAPAAAHPEIWAVSVVPGDPQATGTGPEVIVRMAYDPTADQQTVRHAIAAISAAWASDDVVTRRVDSISVQPIVAPS